MPRYAGNRIGSEVSKESLIGATLRDRPVVSRNYYADADMVGLLQRLQAAEEWARGLNAAPEVTMLVAAALEPRNVAHVFDDLGAACHEAAPPNQNQPVPSDRAKAWLSEPVSHHKALDRLVHVMFLLGEHLSGSWTWAPPHHAINPDGSLDESIPWEPEYVPPPDDVAELISALGLVRAEEDSWTLFKNNAVRAYRTLRLLASSAVADASNKIVGVMVRGDEVGAEGPPAPNSERNRARHERLVALINEIGTGAEGDSELATRWWRQICEQLGEEFDAWMVEVPPTLPVGNVNRQSIKKKVSNWVGYVLQYAGLLTGNAAAFELVRLTKYLAGVSDKIKMTLKAEHVTAPRSQQVCDEVRAAYCRAIVSASVEERWRRRMGKDAEKVGRMIMGIVGPRGQPKALKKESLVAAADRAGLLTATEGKSRYEAVDALLVRMQACGLAARVPVTFFRSIDNDTPRNIAKARRCIHAARDWWFNPLGAVLAEPRRADSPSAT